MRLPDLKHLRVAMNHSTNNFKLVDRRTGQEKLTVQVNENFQRLHVSDSEYGNPNGPWGGPMIQQFQPNRFGYHSVGHLIVANLGQYLVAVDAVTHRTVGQELAGATTAPQTTAFSTTRPMKPCKRCSPTACS